METSRPAADQAPPFPDNGALMDTVRQLHTAVDQLDVRIAAHLGIARNDLRCLNLLERGPVTPGRIAAQLDLTSGSVTALIDRLEALTFVRRQRDPSDRRGVLVEATPLAHSRLAEAYCPFEDAMAKLAARYGPERSAAAAKHISDAARICDWAAAKVEGGAD